MGTGNPLCPEPVKRAKRIQWKMTGESGMIEGDDMSEESGEVEVVEATLAGLKTTGLEEVAIQQEISQDEAEGADKTPARGLLLEEKKHVLALGRAT